MTKEDSGNSYSMTDDEYARIRIEYNGIGFIPIHELMAKQTA